jgi:glutamine synthetase
MAHSDSIAPIAERLKTDFGLSPVLGAEIEFYLPGATPEILARMQAACADALCAAPIETEKGQDQYEIALPPFASPHALARQLAQAKAALSQAAANEGLAADFSAKPFADRPGNGLHLHLHLENAQGQNVFYREAEDYSPQLLYALGGMLALMQESMIFFAPTAESCKRFVEKSQAPLTVSWGPNNRTVALRLPNAPMEHKRIEHRVAGADAEPEAVIAAILVAAHYGLANRLNPGPPVHGDAALPVYGKERLVRSEAEATQRFEHGMLKTYLE